MSANANAPAPALQPLRPQRRDARGAFARALCRDTRGLSTVEYVLILALIAVVGVGTWKSFGEQVNKYVKKSNSTIKSKMPSALD